MSRRSGRTLPTPRWYVVGVLLGGLALPSGTHAQPAVVDSAPRVRLSIGGGFAEGPPIPLGGVGSLGYSVQAGAEVGLPVPGLHLRADALVSQWGRGPGLGAHRMGALTAALVARAPARWRAAPYVLGGGGGYAVNASGGSPAPGWTLGAGVQVPVGRRAFFIESRMHAFNLGTRVNTPEWEQRQLRGVGFERWQYTYTPLSVGFRF
ncbi:MAG TPA: hypothetical protein VEZ47_12540 [Gemmatirosa sp.]|nr:hypothetical protein [Gemmatirosa sp.]